MDLMHLLSEIQVRLTTAVETPDHPWRTPVLGTTTEAGPRLRTVVLRRALFPDWCLIAHTDRRSRKVAEIQESAAANWLFYDPTTRVQLSLRGESRVHLEGELFDREWNAAPLPSRRMYLASLPPGTTVPSPTVNLPEAYRTRPPTEEESLPGRQNFAVILTRVHSLDWLQLGTDGNLSAQYEILEGGPRGMWIAP